MLLHTGRGAAGTRRGDAAVKGRGEKKKRGKSRGKVWRFGGLLLPLQP
jgi:hypothetical protein